MRKMRKMVFPWGFSLEKVMFRIFRIFRTSGPGPLPRTVVEAGRGKVTVGCHCPSPAASTQGQ